MTERIKKGIDSIPNTYRVHHSTKMRNGILTGEIAIIDEPNLACASLCWSDSDNMTLTIDHFSCSKQKIKSNILVELFATNESLARVAGFSRIMLMVEPESWLYKHCKRNKFVYYSQHNGTPNFWMIKHLV